MSSSEWNLVLWSRLYGLGHRTAAQFQGAGNLLIASLCRATTLLSDPQRIWCHVELPVTSTRECESDNTKFNTHAPLLYQRGL